MRPLLCNITLKIDHHSRVASVAFSCYAPAQHWIWQATVAIRRAARHIKTRCPQNTRDKALCGLFTHLVRDPFCELAFLACNSPPRPWLHTPSFRHSATILRVLRNWMHFTFWCTLGNRPSWSVVCRGEGTLVDGHRVKCVSNLRNSIVHIN